MHIIKIDPRALNANPDDARQSKSSPRADALLLATVKAVGIIQPSVVAPQVDGGNGYIIHRWATGASKRRSRPASRRSRLSCRRATNDNGAMRSMVENIAREPLLGSV